MPIGHVQVLVVGFDPPDFRGKIIEELERLRESGVVRLIDLILVRKDEDGVIDRVQRSDLTIEEAQQVGAIAGALIGFGAEGEEGAEAGARLGAAAGEDGHILDESDTWFIDDVIPPGSAAAVVLLEHRWAIPLRDSVREAGGFLLADAWVHPTDLVAVGVLAAGESEES
jgi:uncharacterized membrane protein